MAALLTPPIHVRPAPSLDPPYDDEIVTADVPAVPTALAQPPLPLDWSSPPHHPPAQAARTGSSSGPSPARPASAVPGLALPTDATPLSAGRRPRSPARGATMHFLSLCLEVLNGFRPAAHLRPLTAPAEFAGVAAQLARAPQPSATPTRHGPSARREGSAGARPLPARPAGRPGKSGPGTRIRLRELRICEPRAGVVEAAAVLGTPDRAFALALRLERRPAGWLCVLAQVVV